MKKLISGLETLFSLLVISGINIVISGHLLGFVFDLDEDKPYYFNIPIPKIFQIGVKGREVIAGFAAFTISLLFVGVFLSDTAREIFIERMEATDSQWTACQSLATGLSVLLCLLLTMIRVVHSQIMIYHDKRPKVPSLDERAKRLTQQGQANE